MRITDIYQNKKNVLSFEIFPPKKDEELKNSSSVFFANNKLQIRKSVSIQNLLTIFL